VDARVEGGVGALQGVEGEGAHHVGGLCDARGFGEREPAQRADELRAVDEREALLGPEHQRLEPGGGERKGGGLAAPGHDALALADEREREVGERRQVAAGPDRSLRWDHGQDVSIEQRDELLERLEPDAREALRQHVRAQQHERPRLGRSERRADARGVRAHQVHLQLAQPIVRDADVGEVAEAGRHAVDDVAARNGRVDHAPRGFDRLAGIRVELDRTAAARHRFEPREVERGAVDHERRGPV